MVPERVWIADIPNKAEGTKVSISGIVIDKHKARNNILIVQLKDFTGTIYLNVQLSDVLPQSMFWKNTRLQLTGVVFIDSNGNKRIKDITDVMIFGKNEQNNICLSELDSEISKKASNMLMSQICHTVSELLREDAFVEFESRVISYNWQMDGLEPLNVVYPGFGSPTTLVTSPSPQIIDFLKTAMIARAFTESISFSTTFRFKDGATETRVLMAKALDLSANDLHALIFKIAKKILEDFGESEFTYPSIETDIFKETWPDFDAAKIDKTINVISFETDFEVSYENYSSKTEEVIHIIDWGNNILAEGAREVLSNGLVISTITVYPSQFLSLLKKAPARQLQELWRKHGW